MANRTDPDAKSVHGTNPQVSSVQGLWLLECGCRCVIAYLTILNSFFQADAMGAQNLVEKILRSKIYTTMYWKEHCFALTAESLVDKAVDVHFVGGTYGGQVGCCALLCIASC